MESREYPLLRVRGEIALEPRLLGRARGGRDEGVVAVEHDDVPGAEVVAVVSLARISSDGAGVAGAEVTEVTGGRSARVVVVVPRDRIGPGLVTAPRRIVAIRVIGGRAVREGGIADRKHGPGDVVEQGSRGLIVGPV